MAKAGMRRPDPSDPHGTESNRKTHFPKNDAPPVPELQGAAKHGNEKARPIIEDGSRHPHKVFHGLRGDGSAGNTETR
ncbi:MAG: hypothetical protein ACI4PD_06110 [Butyricicoccus sp.]